MKFIVLKKMIFNPYQFSANTLILFLGLLCFTANGTYAQGSQKYSWGNVAIGGGGFVSGIVTSKAQPGLIYARTDVGGAYRWDAVNSKWIPLTDFASDSQQGIFGVESIAIDTKSPNIVYMSTGISYFNSGKSYILRSTDYGATFTVTDVTSQFKINGNAAGRGNGERLQVDPVNSSILFCGTRANGLFQSNDSGTSWVKSTSLNVTTTNNNNGVNLVVMDSTSAATVSGVKKTQRIFVGVSRMGYNNMYRSDDGGLTYNTIRPSGMLDTTLMPNRAVLSGNGYLYITYANGCGPGGTTAEPCNTGQIWKYKIADGTWADVTPMTSSNRVLKPYSGISVDPNNPNRLVASTTNNYSLQYSNVYGDKIYYSTDAGTTWTDVVSRGFSIDANGIPWQTGASIHWAGCIEFDPSNTNRVMIVSGNGTFMNEDITATAGIWKSNVKGLEETVAQNLISIPAGPVVSVIGDYDGFTQNDPTQYALQRHTPTMGSTSGLDYAATSKKVVRVATSIYYSNDIGVTWIKSNIINGSSGQIALSADGNTFLHCPNGSAVTYRSTDNGTSWSNVNGLGVTNARPVADGVNPGKFYAYDNNSGAFLVSTNGGVSFSGGANIGNAGSKIIRTIPGREGHTWVALINGGLTHSEDSGISFTKSTNVTFCGAVGIGKAITTGSYETIFIYGTVNGVLGIHRSTDKGATWVRVNDDAHQYGGPGNGQFVQGDMNVYGQVYMSTAGRGIVLGSSVLSKVPTDISLSAISVNEKNVAGVTISTISATAEDPNAAFTYALVSGSGSTDNAAFVITGNQLNAAISFNYTTKQSYNIRIRATGNGYTFEKIFVINVIKVFTLPANNFKVSVTNKTCSTTTDGKISINAVQVMNYKATLMFNGASTDYPFTSTLDIGPLNGGNYSLCISVVGQTNFQQCYDLVLTEPKPLSVYATVNNAMKMVVLNLSGSSLYQIQVNDKKITTTSDSVTLNLSNGRNDIQVYTDKDCQGVFNKTIYLEDGKQIFPNPFNNTLYVNFGTDISRSANISIYSLFGVLTYSSQAPVNNGSVQLDLSAIKSGTYIIQIKTDTGLRTAKIIKK